MELVLQAEQAEQVVLVVLVVMRLILLDTIMLLLIVRHLADNLVRTMELLLLLLV